MGDGMKGIFRIIDGEAQNEGGKRQFCIGLDLKIAGKEVRCPLSSVCDAYEDLAAELDEIQEDLEHIRKEAKARFQSPSAKEGLVFSPETPPDEIWAILSGIEEEARFMEHFNNLEETKRKAVAEHVLTRCNIFSGRGAVFSARYDSETGFME
jgi:hypothetical protein